MQLKSKKHKRSEAIIIANLLDMIKLILTLLNLYYKSL